MPLTTVHINLGSNMGPSDLILRAAAEAVQALAEGPVLCSSIVESEPWGYQSSNRFLNMGMEFLTSLEPETLLERIQEIERTVSNKFHFENPHRNLDGSYRDRALDIDIIFFGNHTISTPRLTVPHPRYMEREFVLIPLREIEQKRQSQQILTTESNEK